MRWSITALTACPGCMRRLLLKGRGNEARGRGCGDLALVVHEALHARFQRRGDDLYTRVDVPLAAALTSDHVNVPLLDGRLLRVSPFLVALAGEPKAAVQLLQASLHARAWSACCWPRKERLLLASGWQLRQYA